MELLFPDVDLDLFLYEGILQLFIQFGQLFNLVILFELLFLLILKLEFNQFKFVVMKDFLKFLLILSFHHFILFPQPCYLNVGIAIKSFWTGSTTWAVTGSSASSSSRPFLILQFLQLFQGHCIKLFGGSLSMPILLLRQLLLLLKRSCSKFILTLVIHPWISWFLTIELSS